ncbi:MAG TPA: D-alanyl-D-alanine carboxypeptidase/D-alanyl-D-alanine-endopeptidase [Syntrophorhabdaceae bacterium]|nr:D-alanyl-D-alanine carboxypeptidase/D-alanyl-D-alanine-endopeptidase [Syntrophorhabdaceae bacterium]
MKTIDALLQITDRPLRRAVETISAIVLSALLFLIPFSEVTAAETTKIAKLKKELSQMVKEEAFESSELGIAVEWARTGEPLFTLNQKKRFIPASNMKLFTSAAALLSLSPDFTYETKVMTDAAVESGVLKGNLIIVASGDPTISGYFNHNNPTEVFEAWADSLIRAGINQIEGDIIVDNSYFNDSPFGMGWRIDDMDRCYSVPRDAFSFNNNCLALTISPAGSSGAPATVEIEPMTRYMKILNAAVTADSRESFDVGVAYGADPYTIVVSGVVPVNHGNSVKYLSVKNPAEFGAFVFKESLTMKGVALHGKIVCLQGECSQIRDFGPLPTGVSASSLRTLAVYRSPKLSEILKVINRISNNLYTEQLFLTLARENQRQGDSAQAMKTVRDILAKAGLDTRGLFMADGSGLSRLNLITPEQTVSLLRIMAANAYFNVFYDSLASPGQEGTLKNWPHEALSSPIRAKTGTMMHVRNLSGYVTTSDGELIAFSFLCNNYDGDRTVVDGLYNRILQKLSSFSRRQNLHVSAFNARARTRHQVRPR